MPSTPRHPEDFTVARNGLAKALKAAGRKDDVARLDPKRPTDRPELAPALYAVVADADAAELLVAGRLLEVPAPIAFGLGPSLPVPALKKNPAPKAKPKAAAKAAAPPVEQLAVRRAEKRRKEVAKADDRAQRALARAEKAAAAEADAVQAADTERTHAARGAGGRRSRAGRSPSRPGSGRGCERRVLRIP